MRNDEDGIMRGVKGGFVDTLGKKSGGSEETREVVMRKYSLGIPSILLQ